MITTYPLMQTRELRVVGTLDTDDLTPPSGERLTVHGFQASMIVPSALTSTLRATLAFGTGHTTNATKILASYRTIAKDTLGSVNIGGINVIGDADEIVRLTNATFSAGTCITRVVVYWSSKKRLDIGVSPLSPHITDTLIYYANQENILIDRCGVLPHRRRKHYG